MKLVLNLQKVSPLSSHNRTIHPIRQREQLAINFQEMFILLQ